MQRKQKLILLFCFVVFLGIVLGIFVGRKEHAEPNPTEMISKVEAALGDEYKKQFMTELAATLTYVDENNEVNKINYHILKTTYYEKNPAEIVGLHKEALEVLFRPENMDSCDVMKIQDWDAALYKKDDVAFLCWTYSPEISYVLEYNPNLIDDSEIIKMAESAELAE